MSGEDYVIEGTFQNKGCVCQTADDVGYLFGCGTPPQDEVVYVYNTKTDAVEPQQLPTKADRRNMLGPNNGDNVNDILFQIDKEYQAMAMQAHQDNKEFIRDPPPGSYPVGMPPSRGLDGPQPHTHYNVVQEEDDDYAKTSCSMATMMDLILPSGCRKSRSRKNGDGYFANGDGRRSLLCTSPRRPWGTRNANSDDAQSTSSWPKIVKNASDSVVELQSQLKAMVRERAHKKVNSPKDESRQEPSPTPSVTKKDDEKSAEVQKLRDEQASLDQARKVSK
jgi:hypothetical protein